MNNQSVANQLGITRQAVHSSLKRSIPKLYKNFKNKYRTTPYETFYYLITGIGIENQKDINSFFEYLTKEDKNEIKKETEKKFLNLKS
jgi:predicted DNA-binding protein YlxM (UPF0122 family)